jgi:hypothetical protein
MAGEAALNKRMHATRDTQVVIKPNRTGGRVMRGVMLLADGRGKSVLNRREL